MSRSPLYDRKQVLTGSILAVREDWWHQLEHRWTHYVGCVPWMWLLNGKKRTHYAGAWTLGERRVVVCFFCVALADRYLAVNAHELAIISGMAAAYAVGAEYPKELEEDKFALLCFRLYLLLSHGKWYKKGKNRA